MENAREEVEDFGDTGEQSLEDFEKGLESVKQATANAMKVVAGAIAAAALAVVGLAESTREYRTNQAKLTTAFEQAGASAEIAAETYKDLYRVLGDDGQATEAAAHLAQLTTDQKNLAEWTEICQGIYATFGDSLPIESLSEAANETAKTGTLTGALADALNWAGIKEDDFQASLDACNTEAEREQLIRKTLNDTYKKAATNYEKTASKTLAANEAQEKLNRTMGKIGDTVEPILTELKNIGAAILEDLEEPLEDICDFILNDILPAIKKVFNWVKNNKEIVIGAITGITVAYVGYKGAVLASELATKGYTLATLAATAAQKALNIAMKANPVGLIVTAFAALISAAWAYHDAAYAAHMEITHLTEAEADLVKKALEAAGAFREQNEETEKNMQGINSQMGYVKDLAAELQILAGVNGEVAEADRARAEFILGQLNEALGTEYQMVDGVILQYETLTADIYKLIEAKTIQALLEAGNADYVKALQEEAGAYDALVLAQQDYEAQLAICNEKNAEIAALEQQYSEAVSKGYKQEAMDLLNKIGNLHLAASTEEDLLEKKKGIYDEAASNYQSYYDTIRNYEDAQVAMAEENYQKARDILLGKEQAYSNYAEVVDEETAQVLSTLEKEAVDAGLEAERMRSNFENGVAGYTEEMVLEAEAAYEEALAAFANAYADAEGIGNDLGSGLSGGMENTRSSLYQKARSLVSGIISVMKGEADSHSPSKKTIAFGKDLGAGARIGIDKSTNDVVKSAQRMAKKTLIPMKASLQGFSVKDFGAIDLFASASGKVGRLPKLEVNEKWADTLVQKLTEKKSDKPIYLQIDGKTFAEISVNSINQLTKQRGSLALALM